MRLFPNQIKAINTVIKNVIKDHKVLDVEIKNQIDLNKKWGSRDRRNFQQASYDIIRKYLWLTEVSDGNDIIDTYLKSLEDESFGTNTVPENVLLSVPTQLYDIFKRENKEYSENLQAMNQKGKIFIRVNKSLISIAEFKKGLNEHKISYTIYEDDTYGLKSIVLDKPVHTSSEFYKKYGHAFEFQDIGSQSIIDTCQEIYSSGVIIESSAGNGGKTCHLLDSVEDRAMILAFDVKRKRLENLSSRIAKWGHHRVVTEKVSDKTVEKYENMADVLFMDVPCTGSGTLRRQPDLKYRITEKNLDEKIGLQKEIFHQFNSTLKKGGILMYSTCSLFQSENEAQVSYFQENGYELISQKFLQPYLYDGDGFFIAKLKKI